MTDIRVIPVHGIPEIGPGDDLAAAIIAAGADLRDEDVLVVAQKVVSKAEGRMRPLGEHADAVAHDAVRVVRRRRDLVITETRHGFVCANSGVDRSNAPEGMVVMLPEDPDLSARRIRARIKNATGADVAVIVSDTFGRPWRVGQTNVAIGVAGMEPVADHRGTYDMQGRELSATVICVADEIAGAAELVMGKATGVCAAIVRGAPTAAGRGSAAQIVRPPEQDLFR